MEKDYHDVVGEIPTTSEACEMNFWTVLRPYIGPVMVDEFHSICLVRHFPV